MTAEHPHARFGLVPGDIDTEQGVRRGLVGFVRVLFGFFRGFRRHLSFGCRVVLLPVNTGESSPKFPARRNAVP